MARMRGVDIDRPDSPVTMSFMSVLAILVVVVMAPFAFAGASNRATGGSASPPRGAEKEWNNNKEKERKAR
jgi:hypothetical protein